jgi:hypothetical protein
MERKAKLIKTDVNYLLENSEGVVIASTSLNKGGLKLSKQNCDEIFGVIDVEKLAENYEKENFNGDLEHHPLQIFKAGFNKALELNKDKVFTLKNVVELASIFISNPIEKSGKTTQELVDSYIQSLQQPTEIEVKIVMEYVGKCNGNNDNGCFQDSSGHNCGCFNKQPKIDSENFLILKKI